MDVARTYFNNGFREGEATAEPRLPVLSARKEPRPPRFETASRSLEGEEKETKLRLSGTPEIRFDVAVVDRGQRDGFAEGHTLRQRLSHLEQTQARIIAAVENGTRKRTNV